MRLKIERIRGPEGDCLVIGPEDAGWGRRVAGPKPWGGGKIVQTWTVDGLTFLDDVKVVVEDAIRREKEEDEEGTEEGAEEGEES